MLLVYSCIFEFIFEGLSDNMSGNVCCMSEINRTFINWTRIWTRKFWNSFPDLNSYNLMNDYGAHKRLLDYSSFFIISSCYNSLLTLNLYVWRWFRFFLRSDNLELKLFSLAVVKSVEMSLLLLFTPLDLWSLDREHVSLLLSLPFQRV